MGVRYLASITPGSLVLSSPGECLIIIKAVILLENRNLCFVKRVKYQCCLVVGCSENRDNFFFFLNDRTHHWKLTETFRKCTEDLN